MVAMGGKESVEKSRQVEREYNLFSKELSPPLRVKRKGVASMLCNAGVLVKEKKRRQYGFQFNIFFLTEEVFFFLFLFSIPLSLLKKSEPKHYDILGRRPQDVQESL